MALRIAFEAVWGIGAWIGVIALAVGGVLPYWVACLLNGWIAYLMYMPLHEGTHGNISGAHPKLRWLDDVFGHIGSLPLWYSFSAHRISHMKHHAYANNPERDPDFFVAGPVWALAPKNVMLAVLQTMVPVLTLYPKNLNWLPEPIRKAAIMSRLRRPPNGIAHEGRFIRLCDAVTTAATRTRPAVGERTIGPG